MMKYANYDFDSNYREYVEQMREKYHDNHEHFIKLCFPEEIVRELLMI
jgi:predicted phosphoadenosine phosphosulfate sulfurtransferase